MSTNKSDPRNHHRQPRLYLQGFCEEPPFLWVYEHGKPYNPGIQKRKFNPYKIGIKKLGEDDAYTTVTPDGKRDSKIYEGRLQKIENSTDNILHKIISQNALDANEKEIFAKYIQNMRWRTKKHQEDIRPALDNIQENTQWDNIALSLAENGQFRLAREHYDARKYLKSKSGKKSLILESMVTLHPTVHQILKSMSWKFYVATNGNYFITSNAPVIFDPVGLLVSSLLFPVSKNIALIATHDGKTDLDYVDASLEETLAINYYTITQYASIIYAPKDDYWIWDFLENRSTTTNWLMTLGKIMPFHISN
jgi:hypothetical protein